MATARFRNRDILRSVTLHAEIYETPPDRLAWHVGWALMRLGARLVGFAGLRLEVKELDP